MYVSCLDSPTWGDRPVLECYVYSKSWLKTLITFASPQPGYWDFTHLILQKKIPVIIIFTVVQAPNLVRHMLMVSWAPCQVCWGQNALQHSNLPDKIHYEKDWVLTTNCADENTWPLPGKNLMSWLMNVRSKQATPSKCTWWYTEWLNTCTVVKKNGMNNGYGMNNSVFSPCSQVWLCQTTGKLWVTTNLSSSTMKPA